MEGEGRGVKGELHACSVGGAPGGGSLALERRDGSTVVSEAIS